MLPGNFKKNIMKMRRVFIITVVHGTVSKNCFRKVSLNLKPEENLTQLKSCETRTEKNVNLNLAIIINNAGLMKMILLLIIILIVRMRGI